MDLRRLSKRAALIIVAAVLVIGVVALWPHGTAYRTASTAPRPTPIAPKPRPTCVTSGGAFVPYTATITGVGTVRVLPVPRPPGDAAGTPPETNTGKRMMAWDAPGLKPNGSSTGAVVTDAHSYPDGSALGNTFMAKLHQGSLVELRGDGGTACYRIVSQTVYDQDHVPTYPFSTDGPARLSIIICYWPRLGPGNWQNRMIWEARPVRAA